jgi:type I restriction enzyme S subunit
VDRVIEQTEALIAKQQRLKTGLMQDLLTRGIDEHGNLRSEQTHKFKDSPLGRIPVEWEVNMLGEIAEVRGGKRLPAGHSYSSADTGHRYFRVTDFYRKEIDYFSLEMLEEVTFRALRRYEIKQGDLCVSIAGSLGYFAHYLPPSEFQTILTENAARIVPKTGFIPSLLCSILNSDRVQMQIEEEKGVGGGVPKLALFRIRSLHVPLPSCENEQSRILGSLASQSEAFTATIIALSKLHSLKTALMQDLLTGRKMVTTLLDGKEAIE